MALAKNESPDELKNLPKWRSLERKGFKIELRRFVNGKEVLTRKELMESWGKTDKTIKRNIDAGMPIHEASTRMFTLFPIKECEAWRDGNIDKTQSIKTSADVVTTEEDDEGKLPDQARKLKADADKAEIDARLAEIKLAEADGRLVDANDLDRAMSELAVVHRTDKIHDENLLPVLLENKDAGQIKKLLQDHNFERLEMLDKIVNKEFSSDETMYDIIEAILQQLAKGIEPKYLIERVNGTI